MSRPIPLGPMGGVLYGQWIYRSARRKRIKDGKCSVPVPSAFVESDVRVLSDTRDTLTFGEESLAMKRELI